MQLSSCTASVNDPGRRAHFGFSGWAGAAIFFAHSRSNCALAAACKPWTCLAAAVAMCLDFSASSSAYATVEKTDDAQKDF